MDSGDCSRGGPSDAWEDRPGFYVTLVVHREQTGRQQSTIRIREEQPCSNLQAGRNIINITRNRTRLKIDRTGPLNLGGALMHFSKRRRFPRLTRIFSEVHEVSESRCVPTKDERRVERKTEQLSSLSRGLFGGQRRARQSLCLRRVYVAGEDTLKGRTIFYTKNEKWR